METRRISASSSEDTTISMRGGKRTIAPEDFRAIFVESRFIGIGFDSGGLITRRPDLAALHIAKENVAAPAIASGIFTPARDGNIAPAAVARSGCRDHNRVTAIGK